MKEEDKEIMKELSYKIAKIMHNYGATELKGQSSIGMTHYISEYNLWLHLNLDDRRPEEFILLK